VAQVIDAFPHYLNKAIELRVDDRPTEVKFTSSEWSDFWRPFLTRLAEARDAHHGRMMIAVAGPPGAGKSVFAEKLSWLLNKGAVRGATAMALPQDGFHYDGYYLRSNFRTLPDGEKICLADVKGANDTFDAVEMKKSLERLRANADNVGWPGYDRREHETVPNRFRVADTVNMVIVEGSYLLVDKGLYAGIPQLFDLRIYIDTSGARIIAGLMQRHLGGGKTVEQAKAWVKRVDLPNAQLVDGSKARADVIVKRNDEDALEGFTWPPARKAG
jgi:pantothenate kinase